MTGLPTGQNTRTSWAGSNLLHTQVNLTPTNILFGDFLFNIENQTHYGPGSARSGLDYPEDPRPGSTSAA